MITLKTTRESTPFKCEQCGMTFSQSYTLKKHSRKYTIFGPYINVLSVRVNSQGFQNNKCPNFSGEVPKTCNICLWPLTSFTGKDHIMHFFFCKKIRNQKLQGVNVREEEDVKRENKFDRNVEEFYLCDEVKEKDHKQMKECQKGCENIVWKM